MTMSGSSDRRSPYVSLLPIDLNLDIEGPGLTPFDGQDRVIDLHQRLIVDPGAGFGDRGDLDERERSPVFEELRRGGGFGAGVRQKQRDQDIARGHQQAHPAHPFEKGIPAQCEEDRQEDRADQTAAEQDESLCLQVIAPDGPPEAWRIVLRQLQLHNLRLGVTC